MTTQRKPTAAEPAAETPRRERALGWAELAVDTAASTQKQWNDIAFAYGDLAFKAARQNLAVIESFFEESRKAMTALAQARKERAQAILDRIA